MPIAAVPRYLPEKLFVAASPGLRFGMYLRLWGVNRRSQALLWKTNDIDYESRGQDHREREVTHENKELALREACKLTPSDQQTMLALAHRQRGLAEPFRESGALLTLDAVAVAPFTTGLGNEHPLENGFAFLSPYGLPYLPGSGIKGVVRQAAWELASGEWGDAANWDSGEVHLLKVGRDEIRLSSADVLFGLETERGESEHVRGCLSFWEVFPQIDGDQLMVDVMTPHQGHYYQRCGTPHDSGSPTPITFLTVPPKSRFTFHVLCDLGHLRRLAPSFADDERWKGMVKAAFMHAFEWLGFGAKTSVGYGAFVPAPPSKGAAEQPPTSTHSERARAPARPPPSATVWSQARLQFNAQNGTLTAIGPEGARANAFRPRGDELLSRLPEELQRRVRANQFVRATVGVQGAELIDVEVGS
jgi:CRISPR-associated protein Cmr6